MELIKRKDRILIIGPNGSGKSTLSKKLGEYLNIDVYHIDKIYWESNWIPVDKDVFNKRIMHIMQEKDKYILDGDYIFNLETRIKYADLIIWLKIPIYRCLFNLIKRKIINYNNTREDMAPNCKEKLNLSFLMYAISYKHRSGVKTEKLLNINYNKSLVIISNYRMLKNLIDYINYMNPTLQL